VVLAVDGLSGLALTLSEASDHTTSPMFALVAMDEKRMVRAIHD